MTIYVFDAGPLIDLFKHYYRDRFPTLWQNFDRMLEQDRITSTREVFNEIHGHSSTEPKQDDLALWCREHRRVFPVPSADEIEVVRRILSTPHYQALIARKKRANGGPVADPVVIARAKCEPDGCVVTTERRKAHAAKIPNACDEIGVASVDLEGFMEREKWRF